ncbi:MAG: hypothetical protein H0U74_02255 [Bradymonadaceae bacterium]|nr:hypothetical protein [Lujinxingiaceae bacterium]
MTIALLLGLVIVSLGCGPERRRSARPVDDAGSDSGFIDTGFADTGFLDTVLPDTGFPDTDYNDAVDDADALNHPDTCDGCESALLLVTLSGSGSGTVSSNPAGIDCGSSCSAEYPFGTTVTLTAVPSADNTFTGWFGACSGAGQCTVLMTEARSVTAAFSLATATPDKTLGIGKDGNGSGTVSSSPAGIDCGPTCTVTFAHATEVTLSASPDASSTFAGWSGTCIGTGTCVVSMTESRSVQATFTLKPHTLTVVANGSGTVTSSPAGINCGASCTSDFGHGTEVTLSAVAAANTGFAGWSGDCTGTGDCTVTMTEARTVSASFLPLVSLEVTRQGLASGTVSSSPAGIDCGSTCTAHFAQDTAVILTASPLNNLSAWSNLCAVTAPCTVTMSQARTVNARFSELFSWGRNLENQVGDGSNVDGHVPLPVNGDQLWVQLSAGNRHTCAIRSDTLELYCWGDNTRGQLGDGTNTRSSSPKRVGTNTWKQVATGASHTCAIASNNRLYCWGHNTDGQVGDGSVIERQSPVVVGIQTWNQVEAGTYHTCAIRADNSRLYCWGYNTFGQLGDGAPEFMRSTPVEAGTLTWKQVSVGREHTCGIRDDNSRLYCWGRSGPWLGYPNSEHQSTPQVVGTNTWKQVSAGFTHTCAIRADNDRAYCWGNNIAGELGDGSPAVAKAAPTAVTSTDTWKQISAGTAFTCGIQQDDLAYCWGLNGRFQLGNTNSNTVYVPGPTYGSRTWRQVSAGGEHTAGILTR